MGEAFYSFLVQMFNARHAIMTEDQMVWFGLSNILTSMASAVISGLILWVSYNTEVLHRTIISYALSLFFALLCVAHLGHVVVPYANVRIALDMSASLAGMFVAYLLWASRHKIFIVIHKFRYVIGLVNSLDTLKKVER